MIPNSSLSVYWSGFMKLGSMEPSSSSRVDIHGLAYLALDYRRFTAPLTARSRLSPRFGLQSWFRTSLAASCLGHNLPG